MNQTSFVFNGPFINFTGFSLQVVASFFPLKQCVEGLKLITRSLFGVTLKEVSLARGEGWHPGVQKFTLQHSDEVASICFNNKLLVSENIFDSL